METGIIIALLVAFLAWRMMPTKGVNTISTAQLKNTAADKMAKVLEAESRCQISPGP